MEQKEQNNIVSTSVRLTRDMHEWYKKEAEKIGVPLNAMIIFALLQFQREQMVIPNVPGMIDLYNEAKKNK